MIDRAALDLVMRWPQLASPVPPEPLSPQCRVQHLVAAECFAEPLALRCPADNLAGLAGPIIGHGICMEPQFPSGAAFWIDPALSARDGDLVAVWISEPEMQRIVERNRGRPGWLETYTDNPNRLVIKLLRQLGNEYYLVSAAGLFPMDHDNHRILGVVRALAREFSVPPPGSPVAHCIVNGTIAASKLAVLELEAVSANTGNLNVSGTLNVATSGVIKSGQSAFNTGTGYWLDYNGGSPRFSIGNPSGNRLTWDTGTGLLNVHADDLDIGGLSSFSPTWIGISAPVINTVYYRRLGGFVMLTPITNGAAATSDVLGFQIPSSHDFLYPAAGSSYYSGWLSANNGGTSIACRAFVSPAGVVSFERLTGTWPTSISHSTSGWATSGVKAVSNQVIIFPRP